MIDKSQFCNKTIAYHTLGCKLNFAETTTIARTLTGHGFRKARAGEQAGVCIINTCSVTDAADKKCRQAIGQFVRKHPDAFVVVTGCYAQLRPQEIGKIKGVDLVLGNNEKFIVSDFLHSFKKKKEAKLYTSSIENTNLFQPAISSDDRTRYFLKVQDGCDYYCSYCTVPFARGKSRNGTIKSLVETAQELGDKGAKEIVLSGVNIGDFGKSTGETFFDLLKALDKVEKIARFRISSIEPNLLTDEIIAFIAQSQHFAPHFHIPLQSGSNEVLALMKRRYTRELFAEKVAKIKLAMPDAFIGVDVIVGVRGETEACFQDTYSFIAGLDVSQLHVFTYSERPDTKALEIEHIVSPAEKKRRSELLHLLSEEKTQHFYASQIGKTAKVLWEAGKTGGLMNGFTENYVKIHAPYQKELVNMVQEIVIEQQMY